MLKILFWTKTLHSNILKLQLCLCFLQQLRYQPLHSNILKLQQQYPLHLISHIRSLHSNILKLQPIV